MTVAANDRLAGPYVATSGQTTFPYGFRVLAAAELSVVRRRAGAETELTLDSDYAVTGVGSAGGGNIVLAVGATAGDIIAVAGDRVAERGTDLSGTAALSATLINAEMDRLTVLVQELRRDADRAVRLRVTDDTAGLLALPQKADRADRVLAFDDDGRPVAFLTRDTLENGAAAAAVYADAAAASAAAAEASADRVDLGDLDAAVAAAEGHADTAAANAAAGAATAISQATAQATAAASSATAAAASAVSAANAGTAIGPIAIYIFKSDADAALAGLAANIFIDVLQDESRGGIYARYQKIGGSMTYIMEMPGSLAGGLLQMLRTQSLGRVPAVDTGVTNTQISWVIPTAAPVKGRITKLHFCSAAGSGVSQYVTVGVCTKSGSTFTPVAGRRRVVKVASGVTVTDNIDLPINAGEYPYVRGALGCKQTSGLGTGQPSWFSTVNDLTSATLTTGIRPEVGVEIEGDVAASAHVLERGVGNALETVLGREDADVVAGTAWTNAFWLYPEAMEAPANGVVTEFSAWGTSAGVLSVAVVERWTTSGTKYAKLIRQYSAEVGSGKGTIYPNLDIAAGQFLAFRHSGTAHNTSTGGQGVAFSAGTPTTDAGGTALTAASPAQTLAAICSAKVRGSVNGDITAIKSRLSALEGSGGSWAGKKIAILGSSITALGNWTTPFIAASGAIVENLGVSGASLGQAGSGGTGGLGIYNQIVNIDSDSAGVILESGTNDFGAGKVPLGALGDTTTATFYGALYAAIGAIYAQAPNAVVWLTTPYSAGASQSINTFLHVRSPDGARLWQFQKAIRDTAELFGVGLIDFARDSGVNYYTAADYLPDGLHPGTAGGTRMALLTDRVTRTFAPRP
jgi:hypothetical protein